MSIQSFPRQRNDVTCRFWGLEAGPSRGQLEILKKRRKDHMACGSK